MTDRTTQTLRTAMRELADMAPAAPDLPVAGAREVARQPFGAFAGAFAAVVVVVGLGMIFVAQRADETQTIDAGDTVTTTIVPTTVAAPTTGAPSDATPTPTTVATPPTETWTDEDSRALLTGAEWDRIASETPADGLSEERVGDWDARDLKWHEDDLLSSTGLERGEQLPLFGSALIDNGTVDPASIIANGRPLFVLVWRPSPWLVAGTEETTDLNLDAFQLAYDRWGDQIDFIGVIWNEPVKPVDAIEGVDIDADEILALGRQVVTDRGYTFPNVVGRADLPQVPELWQPMWLLADADGRLTGGFFAHGAVRQADTSLDSLPVDHLLSRLIIPIDDLADILDERFLWTPVQNR